MHVLVICNGTPPSPTLFEKCVEQSDLLIAADGGGNIAHSMGRSPDLVIGDLDSYQKREDRGIDIIHDSDQETNDLEKALSAAKERNADRVTILGGTGRRIDQTLKNLSVLKRFNRTFDRIEFRDDYGTTFLAPSPYTADLPAGTLVSLFPLSGEVSGITTEGLEYPLENESLEVGIRDGLSNRVTQSPITIEYHSGDLLLFVANNPDPS